jgi:PAS domain S-box-containing protein
MKDKNKIKNSEGIQREKAYGPGEAELKYGSIFDQSPDGILIIDAEGNILDFNKAAHNDLGYSKEEFSKLRISDIDPVESPEEIRAHIQKTISEGKAEFEVTHKTKSGQLRNVLIITQTIVMSGNTVLHTIWRDITDQKAAGKALLESEAKYRDFFENAGDAVFVLDSELRYVDVNRKGLDLFGYTREELLGRQPFDFIPEEQRPNSAAEFDKLRGKGSYESFEGRLLTKDGRWIDIEVNSTAILKDGVFAGSRDIVRDITERKRIEEYLRKRERQLSESQKVARIGSWSWDTVNNTLEWSDETYRRFEKDPDTFTPTSEYFLDRIHPDDREAVQRALQDSLKNNAPYHIQPRIINETGAEWVLEGYGIVERDVNGNPLRFAGTAQDITEHKKAEDALQARENFLDTMIESSPT